MTRLVVTADDFGLAKAVNEAVEAAHRDGILTAASLMVAGPAAQDAVARARRLPGLRVGLHVVLVDGLPMLPAREVSDLLDGTGRLRTDLVRFGLDIALRPSLRRQLTAEITAQFEAFRQTGLPLDHVNAHWHYHVNPLVAGQIIAVGRHYGMRALRVPIEPSSVLCGVEPRGRTPLAIRPWAALLRMQAHRAGLTVPDAIFGLAWSGSMTERRLLGLLGHLPPGLVEIYTHPATDDTFEGHAPGYRYKDEFAALTAPACIAAARASGARLGGYVDCSGSPASAAA